MAEVDEVWIRDQKSINTIWLKENLSEKSLSRSKLWFIDYQFSI